MLNWADNEDLRNQAPDVRSHLLSMKPLSYSKFHFLRVPKGISSTMLLPGSVRGSSGMLDPGTYHSGEEPELSCQNLMRVTGPRLYLVLMTNVSI